MKHTMANDRVLSIRKELRRLADKDIAEHSQRFFKTGKGQYGQGDRFLGIRVPALRMLVAIFKKANDEGRRAIYTLYLENTRFINNWDLVDCSAGHIVGAYLRGSDKQPLYDLAVSDSLWERRIAIMSTFGFIKHNEFTDTLRIAKIRETLKPKRNSCRNITDKCPGLCSDTR
jgi:hypothetical protein